MLDNDPYTVGLMVSILIMQFLNAGAIIRLNLKLNSHCKDADKKSEK